MAVKLFPDNVLLLEVYIFKGFLNQNKNDGMANNYIQIAVTSSNFKKSNITKDCYQHCFRFQPCVLDKLLKL